METRAHHLLIGSFAIGITFLMFLFTLWISKSDIDVNWKEYDIVFSGSVAGLKRNADVLYNGLKVGEVHDLGLEKADPSKVRVRIRVKQDTPVNTETRAKLSAQLLTGLAVIGLTGGKEGAEAIKADKDGISFITAAATPGLDQLTANADELIAKGTLLADNLNAILVENRENITSIIANAKGISDELLTISKKADEVATAIVALSDETKGLVTKEGRKALTDAAGAAAEARMAMTELKEIFKENRPPVREFTKNALPETFLFVSDARQLIGTIERFATRLERSPSSLFFGDKAPEYTGTR